MGRNRVWGMNSSYHSISLGSSQGWFHKIQIEGREPPPTLLAPSPNPPLTIFLETLLRNFWEHFEKRGSRSHGPPSSPFSRPRIPALIVMFIQLFLTLIRFISVTCDATGIYFLVFLQWRPVQMALGWRRQRFRLCNWRSCGHVFRHFDLRRGVIKFRLLIQIY